MLYFTMMKGDHNALKKKLEHWIKGAGRKDLEREQRIKYIGA